MVEGTRGCFEQVCDLDVARQSSLKQCRCRHVRRALQADVRRVQAGNNELGVEERASLVRLNRSNLDLIWGCGQDLGQSPRIDRSDPLLQEDLQGLRLRLTDELGQRRTPMVVEGRVDDEFAYRTAVDDIDELVEQRQLQVVAHGGGCLVGHTEDPWCVLPSLLEPGPHGLVDKSASDHLLQEVLRRNEGMEVLGVFLRPAIGRKALPLRRKTTHTEIARPDCKESLVFREEENQLGVSGARQPHRCENICAIDMTERAGVLDRKESAIYLSTVCEDQTVLRPVDLSPQVSFVERKVSAVRGDDDAVPCLVEQRWHADSRCRHAPSAAASGSNAPDAGRSPSIRRSSPSSVRP